MPWFVQVTCCLCIPYKTRPTPTLKPCSSLLFLCKLAIVYVHESKDFEQRPSITSLHSHQVLIRKASEFVAGCQPSIINPTQPKPKLKAPNPKNPTQATKSKDLHRKVGQEDSGSQKPLHSHLNYFPALSPFIHHFSPSFFFNSTTSILERQSPSLIHSLNYLFDISAFRFVFASCLLISNQAFSSN